VSQVLKIDQKILPSQLKLIDETAPYTALIAGSGAGKTLGGALKALKFVANYPGIHGIVTAPSYKVLEDATIPAYEKVFTRDVLLSLNKTDMIAETCGGGKLFFRTTKDPYLIRGITAGFFHMDEGADSPALAFKILQARLRQPGMPQQGWITTTPKGFNWVYSEFGAQKRANYVLINAHTVDNVFLPDDYVDKLKESYTDEQFLLQELEGQFIEVGAECPFDMKALNEMYHEARDREAIREEDFVRVYAQRQIGKRYVIGADAATGQGEDESAFVVALLDPISTAIVCSGKAKIPEVEFAEVLANKSKYYNNALIVVENAPVGKATLIKLDEMHCNVYKQKDKLGWPTTGIVKPMMVADLAEAIKDRGLAVPDSDIIEQFMGYARTKEGKYQASGGGRDDYVSAMMLMIQGIKAIPSVAQIKVIYT